MMLKRRTKLVSFRISDEEYERLHQACLDEGARSISDFARSALQRSVHVDSSHEASSGHSNGNGNGHSYVNGVRPASADAQELIDTIRELNRQLAQLVSFVQSIQ